jgi:hypothetical protein
MRVVARQQKLATTSILCNTPPRGYSVQSSLEGDKCLGGYFKFLISKHSPDFLFFIPLKGELKRMTGFLEYSVQCPLEG